MRQEGPPKCRHIFTRIYGTTLYKTAIFGTPLVLSTLSHHLISSLSSSFLTALFQTHSLHRVETKHHIQMVFVRFRLQILALKLGVLSDVFHAFLQPLPGRTSVMSPHISPLIPRHRLILTTWICRQLYGGPPTRCGVTEVNYQLTWIMTAGCCPHFRKQPRFKFLRAAYVVFLCCQQFTLTFIHTHTYTYTHTAYMYAYAMKATEQQILRQIQIWNSDWKTYS